MQRNYAGYWEVTTAPTGKLKQGDESHRQSKAFKLEKL